MPSCYVGLIPENLLTNIEQENEQKVVSCERLSNKRNTKLSETELKLFDFFIKRFNIIEACECEFINYKCELHKMLDILCTWPQTYRASQ